VRRAPDGTFTHLCRADDMLNLGGYKVAPAEIEEVARSVKGVADCRVVAATDEHGLEHAVVYAVAEPGTAEARAHRDVLAAMRRDLAAYKRPTRIEFLDALPLTVTGKVATFQLRGREVRL